MTKIEKFAKSLNTIINKVGCDGTAVSPTEVILADGTKFTVEYIQQNGDGVYLSDADGDTMFPFTDLADEVVAGEVYDLTVSALVD